MAPTWFYHLALVLREGLVVGLGLLRGNLFPSHELLQLFSAAVSVLFCGQMSEAEGILCLKWAG
jgi:hypothetical protein